MLRVVVDHRAVASAAIAAGLSFGSRWQLPWPDDRSRSPRDRVPATGALYRPARGVLGDAVHHAVPGVLGGVLSDVHLHRAAPPRHAPGGAAGVSGAARASGPLPRGRRAPSRREARAECSSILAHDPRPRPLHGHCDHRRRWQRQDQRLHVSVRAPAVRVPTGRYREAHWRPCAGSEGRLLPPGASHPDRPWPRGRLRRGRPGGSVALQPAPQRSGCVRARVWHCVTC